MSGSRQTAIEISDAKSSQDQEVIEISTDGLKRMQKRVNAQCDLIEEKFSRVYEPPGDDHSPFCLIDAGYIGGLSSLIGGGLFILFTESKSRPGRLMHDYFFIPMVSVGVILLFMTCLCHGIYRSANRRDSVQTILSDEEIVRVNSLEREAAEQFPQLITPMAEEVGRETSIISIMTRIAGFKNILDREIELNVNNVRDFFDVENYRFFGTATPIRGIIAAYMGADEETLKNEKENFEKSIKLARKSESQQKVSLGASPPTASKAGNTRTQTYAAVAVLQRIKGSFMMWLQRGEQRTIPSEDTTPLLTL